MGDFSDQMFRQEEAQLLHAIQSGVAQEADLDHREGRKEGSSSPKHLRVGINSVFCSHAALAKLLIDKGIITDEEYQQSILGFLRLEKEAYETRLSARLGAEIKLA